MNFRTWCREKWFEHKDELEAYGQTPSYTADGYFQMYKYWLKREYRHQQRNI